MHVCLCELYIIHACQCQQIWKRDSGPLELDLWTVLRTEPRFSARVASSNCWNISQVLISSVSTLLSNSLNILLSFFKLQNLYLKIYLEIMYPQLVDDANLEGKVLCQLVCSLIRWWIKDMYPTSPQREQVNSELYHIPWLP